MHLRSKIIVLVILIILVWSFVGYLPADEILVRDYARNIFSPYQSVRGKVFGFIPISIGDLLYVLAGFALVSAIVRWVYYVIKFGLYTEEIAATFLNLVNTVLFVYLLFIISWGGNYYKPSLRTFWGLEDHATEQLRQSENPASIKALRARDSASLIAFDGFLVEKLNRFAPCYRALSLREINDSAGYYFRNYTNSKVKGRGLWVKPSLFSFFIERLGIEGYYNPFTGEGQVNTDLPAFMLPFVVCHEIAHQAGIAAEGDANLMSYTLCTTTDDTSFRYSAYLNIWLYANNRLYRRDSALASRMEAKLNVLTRSQLDTLDELSKKYNNGMARYSNELYDSYLKMEKQKDGIKSYGDVTLSAWQVEQRRKKGPLGVIEFP